MTFPATGGHLNVNIPSGISAAITLTPSSGTATPTYYTSTAFSSTFTSGTTVTATQDVYVKEDQVFTVSVKIDGNEAANGNGGTITWNAVSGTHLYIAPAITLGAVVAGLSHADVSQGTAPTAAAGANNGTTPPPPVVAATSTDTRGGITFGSGSTPAAGAQCVVTFSQAWAATPYIELTPNNNATDALVIFPTSVSTTGFTVSTNVAPSASQANTVYSFNYSVFG